MAKKYKPFATSRQSMDWQNQNCGSCKKGFDNKGMDGFRCEWEKALCLATMEGGLITEETAKAIGYLDHQDCTIWECPGWKRGRK
jgi:hypothetical protein